MTNLNENTSLNNYIQGIFESKKEFHKEMAQLPIQEKIKRLVKLQKIGYEAMKATGRKLPGLKMVWDIKV